MGVSTSSTACECQARDENEERIQCTPCHQHHDTADLSDEFAKPSQDQRGVPALQMKHLEGLWRNEAEDVNMGCMGRNGVLVWDEIFSHAPTQFSIVAGGAEMQLYGVRHRADFDWGPPRRLRWSDGDVWCLVPARGEEGQTPALVED